MINPIGLIRYWRLAGKMTLPKTKAEYRMLKYIASRLNGKLVAYEERVIFSHYDRYGNVIACGPQENALAQQQLNQRVAKAGKIMRKFGFEWGKAVFSKREEYPNKSCCEHTWRSVYEFIGKTHAEEAKKKRSGNQPTA